MPVGYREDALRGKADESLRTLINTLDQAENTEHDWQLRRRLGEGEVTELKLQALRCAERSPAPTPIARRATATGVTTAANRSHRFTFDCARVGFQQEGTLHSQNLSPLTCPLA